MAANIYIIERYGIPIFFGTIPASKLNLTLDQPLIAAGLYALHQFGLRNATTKVIRTTILYKKGAAVTLTFHNFQEAATIRMDYDALEIRERLARYALGEQEDSTIEFELDLHGIAIDLVGADLSETSLRTLAFLRGLLSTMATEFQRNIINVCRRGLSYTQYSQNFERRMAQVLQRVAEGIRTKRRGASTQGFLRDYETILEMQIVWKNKPKTADVAISFQKKVDFGVQPNILALLIVATKNMLEEIFEPICGSDVEFLVIDLDNGHRVFVAYQKDSRGKDLYSVHVNRITEKVSSYKQEETILEDVRTKLHHIS